MDEFQAAQRRWGYYEETYKVGRISEEDYKKEQTKWDEFHCETLSDYVDLYCSQDTLLLADIFEAFRDQTQKHFDLDPAHFLTLPNCQ